MPQSSPMNWAVLSNMFIVMQLGSNMILWKSKTSSNSKKNKKINNKNMKWSW